MRSIIYDEFTFFFNSGFDGDVIINDKTNDKNFRVPFAALKKLVVEYVRGEKIAQLEYGIDDEILFS